MQTITPDFLMSQLRLALVALLAYGGGKGWFTPADTTFYLALASSLGPVIVPWAWSIFSNLGRVSVVSGSAAAQVAAIEKRDPASASVGASAATAAVVKILLIAFVLSTFLASGAAMAQARRPLQITGDPIADTKSNLGIGGPGSVLTGNASKDLIALYGKLQAVSKTDLQYALNIANKKNNVAAGQCWTAIITQIDQDQSANLDANGQPLPTPDPHLFTDVERLSDVINSLGPNSPLMVGCGSFANQAKMNVLQLISTILAGGAGLAAFAP